MNDIAKEAGVVLGVSGADLNEIYDTVAALEKAGNKNLVIDATGASVKEAYANAVQIRRAALKDQDRTFGYPTIVNTAAVAHGDRYLQQALASLFTVKYGSIVVMETLDYAEALPLFGLRQNVFTDPQKPMKVEPGIYPLNGADENSLCLTTVDFALTYFVVSGELERSGVPCNLIISDAGGLSVLTTVFHFCCNLHQRKCRRQSKMQKTGYSWKSCRTEGRYRVQTSWMGNHCSSSGGCTVSKIPERFNCLMFAKRAC